MCLHGEGWCSSAPLTMYILFFIFFASSQQNKCSIIYFYRQRIWTLSMDVISVCTTLRCAFQGVRDIISFVKKPVSVRIGMHSICLYDIGILRNRINYFIFNRGTRIRPSRRREPLSSSVPNITIIYLILWTAVPPLHLSVAV